MKAVDIWLRKECEKLEEQIAQLKEKIIKIMKGGKVTELEKAFKLKSELGILKGQQNKLYEMLRRIDEIKSFETHDE